MAFGRSAAVVALVLLAAACGSADDDAIVGGVFAVPNQGGDMEGHTPTGFAGSGTELFTGDNLNSSFPEGQGVQLFLTFELPAEFLVGTAVVVSDALETSGAPFDDLGDLLIEPVDYAAFGPPLFDLAATGDASRCEVVDGTGIECDVSAAVQASIESGAPTAQFRMRFEQAADNDGQQDLALFNRGHSNANEAGIFELRIVSG